MVTLSEERFHDDAAARKYLEGLRWPDGPVCPHCGNVGKIYPSKRPGRYRCGERQCRKDFTVTVGTLFERSHVPLHKWVLAVHLLCASKKSMSSHQLHRMLGVTYKTAWFMSHRIREAMRDGFFARPMGGAGRAVEADETFWGNEHQKPAGARGYQHKMKILTLVERDGTARSFHVASVNADTLKPILVDQIAKDTDLMTDEASYYLQVGKHFASHGRVTHSANEWARGPIHTQTVESFFSLLKRGLYGTFHHVSPKHLRRYVGEFDFRWNTRKLAEVKRAAEAVRGIEGKRLLYRDSLAA